MLEKYISYKKIKINLYNKSLQSSVLISLFISSINSESTFNVFDIIVAIFALGKFKLASLFIIIFIYLLCNIFININCNFIIFYLHLFKIIITY